MFDGGFIEEVSTLLSGGGLCPQARAACGYEELIGALGDMTRAPRQVDIDLAAESTKIRSRRLAKQQRTWLKRFRALRPGIAIECADDATAASLADACEVVLARA